MATVTKGAISAVQYFTRDSIELVSVPLCGVHAGGRCVVVEAADWENGLAAGWPEQWFASHTRGDQSDYAVTRQKPFSNGKNQVVLARLILGAKPGDVVLYKDRDPFNLRRSNLFLGTRSEATQHVNSATIQTCPTCGHRSRAKAASTKAARTPPGRGATMGPKIARRPPQRAPGKPTVVSPAEPPLCHHEAATA